MSADAAHRPARHARHPARTLPAADALHQPWLAHGGGHHARAAGARSGRSCAVRLLALPRRHDERLRLRPPAGRCAMSAERALSSAPRRARRRLLQVVVMLALIGAAFFAGARFATRGASSFAASADGSGVAWASERRCVERSVPDAVGRDAPRRRASRSRRSSGRREPGEEIAWTRDGSRVAFLINGYQLRSSTRTAAPAGRHQLVEPRRVPNAVIARGVTFSDNGAAITFDDCPRGPLRLPAGYRRRAVSNRSGLPRRDLRRGRLAFLVDAGASRRAGRRGACPAPSAPTLKRSRARGEAGLAHRRRRPASFSRRTIASAIAS